MTSYRPGTAADTRTCFEIFEVTVDDLGRRTGSVANSTAGDPNAFELRRPLFDHLAETADEWWMAEDDATGRAVGYARSILRDGVRELTEFFVLPDAQAGGVGRELLARAFPAEGARHRAIVATTDPRAIARYLKTGLGGRLPLVGWEGVPRAAPLETDLVRERLDPGDHRSRHSRRSTGTSSGSAATTSTAGWPASDPAGCTGAKARSSDTPITRRGRCGAVRMPRWRRPTCRCSSRTVRPQPPTPGTDGHVRPGADRAAAIDHLLGRGFRVDPFVMLYFSDGPRSARSLRPDLAAVLRLTRASRVRQSSRGVPFRTVLASVLDTVLEGPERVLDALAVAAARLMSRSDIRLTHLRGHPCATRDTCLYLRCDRIDGRSSLPWRSHRARSLRLSASRLLACLRKH